MDNTHGINLNSWYSIDTPESHTYERAECYPYTGFFLYGFSGYFMDFLNFLEYFIVIKPTTKVTKVTTKVAHVAVHTF